VKKPIFTDFDPKKTEKKQPALFSDEKIYD